MKKTLYLSFRIQILTAVVAALYLFSMLIYGCEMIKGNVSVWPLVVEAFFLIALAALAWMWVIKPYRYNEKNMRLFLDGYTTANMEDLRKVELTPSGARVLEQLLGMMDSSELLKLNKRQAQYLALQNQINPHFLYNTLESIRSEAMIAGLTSVSDMTEALATFFRYTISKVENLVSVEEELQNCETYFSIQQYRFGERLSLSIECDAQDREEIYNCRIPKLTMQPILENSIIHGTECKIGSGNLKISLVRSKKRLLIRISDDGVGIDAEVLEQMNERLEKSGRALKPNGEKSEGGIALVNVNNRIHLLFGEEYGLHVFSMPGVGTDVEITLPAITSDRQIKNQEALR